MRCECTRQGIRVFSWLRSRVRPSEEEGGRLPPAKEGVLKWWLRSSWHHWLYRQESSLCPRNWHCQSLHNNRIREVLLQNKSIFSWQQSSMHSSIIMYDRPVCVFHGTSPRIYLQSRKCPSKSAINSAHAKWSFNLQYNTRGYFSWHAKGTKAIGIPSIYN